MHDDAVTGRCEFLLFKDFLHLKMIVYIHIYIFLRGSKLLQTAVRRYIFCVDFIQGACTESLDSQVQGATTHPPHS